NQAGLTLQTRLDFIVLVMPVAGWILYYYQSSVVETIQTHKLSNLVTVMFVACITFCLTSPYLVLHIPEFLHATVHEFSRAQHIDLINDIFHRRFIAQAIIVFPFILSISVYFFSLYGIYLYAKNKRIYEVLFYFIYPFLYFMTVTIVSDRPSYAGGGYFYLAMLPFIILLGAYGFVQLWDKIERKGIRNLIAVIICIDVLSASGSFVNSIYTHNMLGYWVNKNIPQKSSILMLNSFRPVFQWKYYVYPIYTETIKWSPPLKDSIKVINPGYVIATGFDEYLEGGYKYFNRLMKEDNYHQVEIFMPKCTPYIYLFSTFVPDVNRGTIYVYKYN
ncbi:MAG: hypothetical protein M1428_00165, partial [Deltaproteobacteria bacterium]|nr:hypothetical protein [Deltaproteobacteria bacterium]